MKFTCDSCNAQYMISDDKVGPAGVKVRCKKCGHVILVRRVADAAATGGDTAPAVRAPAGAGPSPSANGATHPGVDAPSAGEGRPAVTPSGGLDAELGSAFDHAFGDTPPATERPASERPGADADLGATQAMGAEDAAKVFSQTQPSPAPTEWYVAIGQAQVGPLPLGEVKKKWEAGDIGPDSLVWRPGMGDWAPLTTVSDLAGFLAPVPRVAARAAARPAEPRAEPQAAAAPAAEVSWKPVGASALAALASEEIASRAPEARPAPVRPAGVKSLVDALPDGGGVDPTGALPLNIKALEVNTGERKIEQRRSAVARGAEKARHRRSATRALVVGLVVGILLVAGGAVAAVSLGWVDVSRILGRSPGQKIAAIPLPPPPALPAAPAPQAAQPVAATPPPAAAPAQPAPPRAAPEPRPEPKAQQKPEPRPERQATSRATRTEPPPARELPKKEPQRVATAQQPPPETKPTKKGGDILDFDSSGDSALDDALGGGSAPTSKRSVYVPPARAGGGALADKVSPGDINGAVAQRMDALRKCVSDQKAREPDLSGTLKMRWLIMGDGSVRDVKCITPEFAQGQFAACLGGVVKSIRFPRSATTGQEVTFPFSF